MSAEENTSQSQQVKVLRTKSRKLLLSAEMVSLESKEEVDPPVRSASNCESRFSGDRVKLKVVRTPWSSPPDRLFPRAHMWSWNEDDAEQFGKEFEQATSLKLVGEADETGAPTENNATTTNNNSKKFRLSPARKLNSSDSKAEGVSTKAAAQCRVRKRFSIGLKDIRRKKRNSSERKGSRNLFGEVESTNIDPRTVFTSRSEEYESTPTPPPEVFGLEGNLDSWYDAHSMLVEQNERENHELRVTSLDTFINACYENSILPEPLLSTKRAHEKETVEASKYHEKLEILSKRDIEKLNSREVLLWDWQFVSKNRTPDELKLEHYGMGDQYMPAMAKGLKVDAAHANLGKRSISRFNLSSCRLTGKGLTYLAEGLRHHSRALKLDVSNNSLGPNGISPISELFIQNAPVCGSLKVLDLSGNGLGDRAIIELFEALRNTSLEWLSLNKNSIGVMGSLAIAKFVESQRTIDTLSKEPTTQDCGRLHTSNLQTLLLDWNKIRGQEACRLLAALEQNDILLEVSLSWNGFGNQKSCEPYLLSMLENNKCIRSLAIAHNLFSKEVSENILRALLENEALLSLDLSGNDRHENIFLRDAQNTELYSVSEGWSFDKGQLIGSTTYIYTRYCGAISTRQKRMSLGGAASQNNASAPKGAICQDLVMEQQQSSVNLAQQQKRQPRASRDTPTEVEQILDAKFWKRREVCWIKHRWQPHTFWYYPGISGPPSNDVFAVLMLPGGGAAMCFKMIPAPSLHSARATAGHAKPSGAMFKARQPSKAKQSTKFLLAARPSFHGTKTRGGVMSPLQKRTSTNMAQRTSKDGKTSAEGDVTHNFMSKMHSRQPSIGIARVLNIKKKARLKFGEEQEEGIDYDNLLHKQDKSSAMGNAILESIQRAANDTFGTKNESLENQRVFSLSQNDLTCPFYATVMLPPGRVQYKFIVNGREVFALDQETCWAKWPAREEATKKSTVISAQEVSAVVNCIDVKWQHFPVCGLPDPDPGSERNHPAVPWSIRKSIFRFHRCDDIEITRTAFLADFSKVESNHQCKKLIGEFMAVIQDLMWSHYSHLSTLFKLLSSCGDNCFAMSFEQVETWLRRESILPESFTTDALFQLYKHSGVSLRKPTSTFGKHYKFMLVSPPPEDESGENDDENHSLSLGKKSDPVAEKKMSTMARPQFIQFLILVGISVFASTSGLTKTKKSKTSKLSQNNPVSLGRLPNSGPGVAKPSDETQEKTDFETPFEGVHYLLKKVLAKRDTDLVHRDVFRRGTLFFQDVVNVLTKNMDFLRRLFDEHSVKGETLHDFIPWRVWMELFVRLGSRFSRISLCRIFIMSKNTFTDFEDLEFAPGLGFLEFLESIVRMSRLDILAENALQAFGSAKKATALQLLAENAEEESADRDIDNTSQKLHEFIVKLESEINS